MHRAGLVFLVMIVAAAGPWWARGAGAQSQITADLGYAHLRQAGLPDGGVATIGVGAELLRDRAWFRARGLASRASFDRWTAQGVAVASWLAPATHRTQWELSGSLSSFGETNASSITSMEFMARLHAGRGAMGGALGAGLGRVLAAPGDGALGHVQADLWAVLGRHQLVGTIAFIDAPSYDVSARPALPPRRVEYAEGTASWRHELGRISLGAAGGARVARLDRSDFWGSADASLWFALRAALVLAVGRSLADVTRGVPGSRYASVAIRVAARPHPAWKRAQATRAGPTVIATHAGLEIRMGQGGATSVEVMGDFTDWIPVSLVNGGGGTVWRLERALRPGPHRLRVRVNGGEWTTPVNLPRVTDDLGGVVGMITIPN